MIILDYVQLSGLMAATLAMETSNGSNNASGWQPGHS